MIFWYEISITKQNLTYERKIAIINTGVVLCNIVGKCTKQTMPCVVESGKNIESKSVFGHRWKILWKKLFG